MSVLKLENVKYSYAGARKAVIEDLSYTFEKGKIYSIVGRSGSGKTTLLSLLSGLASPTSGTIYLNDQDINKIDKSKYNTLKRVITEGESYDRYKHRYRFRHS